MTESKQDIVLAVSKYLAFSDENKKLEAELAEETATGIGGGATRGGGAGDCGLGV